MWNYASALRVRSAWYFSLKCEKKAKCGAYVLIRIYIYIQYGSDARYNERACEMRLPPRANAFAATCLHVLRTCGIQGNFLGNFYNVRSIPCTITAQVKALCGS